MTLNLWPHLRTPRLGLGLAPALLLALTTLLSGLPSTPTPLEQPTQPLTSQSLTASTQGAGAPGEYLHVDAIKKQATCVDPNGVNNAALVDAWRLPTTGLTYKVNLVGLPSGVSSTEMMTAAQGAAGAWVTQGAAPLLFGGTTLSNGTITDGQNVIGFGSTPPGTASVAIMRIVNGVIVEADIVLDQTESWTTNNGTLGKKCEGAPTKFDVQNALTHEFGHWAGVAHTPALVDYSHRTMYPFIAPGELSKRTPSLGDLASIPLPTATPGTFTGTVTQAGDDGGGP